MLPAKTFLFLDEHPESVNDGAFANVCSGNEPGDPPGTTQIIDYPAAFHNGGCGFAFADGHTETHRWQSATLKARPGTLRAGEAWQDMRWLAGNTTVRR